MKIHGIPVVATYSILPVTDNVDGLKTLCAMNMRRMLVVPGFTVHY